MRRPADRTRPLQTRLVVGFVTLAVVTAAGLAAVSEYTSGEMSDRLVSDRGDSILDSAVARLEDQQRSQLVFAELIASDEVVINAVASSDASTAATHLVPLRARLGIAQIHLYTAGEELLALSAGSNQPQPELLTASAAGLSESRAAATLDGLVVEAVTPVKDATGIIGAVVVATVLDNANIGSLSPNDDSELAVFAGDQLVSSTIELGADLGSTLRHLEPQAHNVDIRGESLRVIAQPIDGGTLVTLLPLDDVEAAGLDRRLTLAAGALLVAVLGAGLGIIHARRVTEPVRRSVSVADRIASGRYDQRVDPSDIREINRLGQAVNALAESVEDQMSQLSHQALHDPLTGLANRTLFNDRVNHALNRRSVEVAVLFVDIDDFKDVKDTLGHAAGDALLCEVARRLERVARGEDTVARLGGDEFGILLEGTPAHPGAVAERLLEFLRAPITVPGGDEVAITASIGIAYGIGGADGSDELLRDADTAMYAAKAAGKAQFAAFESEMHSDRIHMLELKADLAQALDRGELFLEYQPIFGFPALEPSKAEALLRWRHPRHGLIPPDRFIPLAESTGLIVPIGRWVLNEACREAATWQAERTVGLSVNVSARQLEGSELAVQVAAALEQTQLDPSVLTIEITESVLMEDIETAVRVVEDLRALGVRVSLDDFGTGYSSLSYLQRLNVDEIKIDKSFVEQLGQDNGLVLIQSVIGMAKSLGAETVAEGIETADQLETLLQLGCRNGQGFHLGQPDGPRSIAKTPLRDSVEATPPQNHAH